MARPIQPAELASLLDEQAAPLELYASQWTRCADDCVQEAFVKLAGLLERPDHPVAWLYRCVRNQALNQARSERRRQRHELIASAVAHVNGSPYHDPRSRHDRDSQSDRADLLEQLKQLDGPDREVIVLRIWSELTWQQIGDLIGASSSTAHRRYVAALQQLKQRLKRPCHENCPTGSE